MLRSLNEVGQTVKRAGAGVGLPSGLEVEAGDAAQWLDARALNGVDLAVSSLDRYRTDPTSTAIGLVNGVEILDELTEVQKLNPGSPAAWNDSVFMPAGLLPYAAKRSTVGLAIHLGWQDDAKDARAFALFANGSLRLRYSDPLVMTGVGSFPCRIVISQRPMPVSGPVPTQYVLDAWELDKRYEQAVQEGVSVPDEAWARLASFSEMTLVNDET